MRTLLLSIAGGGMLVLGFPPYSWAPIAWAGVVLLLWSWQTASNRRTALWSSYLGGAVFFGGLFWWLGNVELIAYLPLVILQSAFFVPVAWVAWAMRNEPGHVWILAVAGAWALAEVIRVRWPWGGFPWGVLGLSVSDTFLRPSAQWIGGSGWSVLLVALAASVVLSIERRVSRVVPLSLGLVALALGVAGVVFPATADGAQMQIAVVQGNSPCPGGRCPNERLIIFENHLELSRTIPPGSVDLVVWPESSTGFSTDPITRPEYAELIGTEARRIGAPFIVGGDRPVGDDQFINANLVFDENGEIVDEYRKNHPVPFGEYVPIRPLFDWIPAIDRVPRDMVSGTEVVTFDLSGQMVGSVISYEGAFARYPRRAVRNGAEVLVVATNEASYGESPASDQFLAISRLRAAELGTDVVHAAVTGKSAVLRADGGGDGPTGLFTGEVLYANARLRQSGPTLFARHGAWLQALAIVVGAGALALRRLELPITSESTAT